MCGLNFLGRFHVTPLLPSDGPSRVNAFCILYIRSSGQALEVGEGALSKLLAGKVYDYLAFSSVSLVATGALAPFRKSHVSLPTSAVDAPGLANVCGDVPLPYLDGFAQCVLLTTRICKNASLVKF